MAFENPKVKVEGLQAAADLSTHQYKFVKVTAAEQVNIATVLGEAVLGVLQNKPDAAGRAAEVAISGSVTKVLSNAAIAAGARVTAAANAKATTALSTHNAAGIALNASSAGDQLISVLLLPTGVVP
jgi:hypothetical protein